MNGYPAAAQSESVSSPLNCSSVDAHDAGDAAHLVVVRVDEQTHARYERRQRGNDRSGLFRSYEARARLIEVEAERIASGRNGGLGVGQTRNAADFCSNPHREGPEKAR